MTEERLGPDKDMLLNLARLHHVRSRADAQLAKMFEKWADELFPEESQSSATEDDARPARSQAT